MYSFPFLLSYKIQRRYPPFLGESAGIYTSVQVTVVGNIFAYSGIMMERSTP
jgi:hypothetical protein